MSVRPFRTFLPTRHDAFFMADEGEPPARSVSFATTVPVRPARLVFEGRLRPRSAELTWAIRETWARPEDRRKPVYFPFVYRGEVAADVEGSSDVAVRLWEEPSGRPLDAELPRAWFDQDAIDPYKGFPFRLITWMVVREPGTLEPRHRFESLLPGAKGAVAAGTDVAEEKDW